VLPVVYTDGALPPPIFEARRPRVAEFHQSELAHDQLGVVLREAFNEQWTLTSGLFRALDKMRSRSSRNTFRCCLNRAPTTSSNIVPALDSKSTSGEVAAHAALRLGDPPRRLEFTVRGRHVDRDSAATH